MGCRSSKEKAPPIELPPTPEPKSVSNDELKTQIFQLINTNSIEEAKMLIEKHPQLISFQDDEGHTPLHLAAQHGQFEFLQFLLKKKADPNSKSNLGNTPLHLAIYHKKFDCAFQLRIVNANENETNSGGFIAVSGLDGNGSYAIAALHSATTEQQAIIALELSEKDFESFTPETLELALTKLRDTINPLSLSLETRIKDLQTRFHDEYQASLQVLSKESVPPASTATQPSFSALSSILSCFVLTPQSESPPHTKPSSAIFNFKMEKILIAGSTGAVGRRCVYFSVMDPRVDQVYAVVRSTPKNKEYFGAKNPEELDLFEKKLKQISPTQIPEIQLSSGISCLGVYSQDMETYQQFIQAEHVPNLEIANIAIKRGAKTWGFLSGSGAVRPPINQDAPGFFTPMFSFVKGLIERDLALLPGFVHGTVAVRPGAILGRPNPVYGIAEVWMNKYFSCLQESSWGCHVDHIAQSLVHSVIQNNLRHNSSTSSSSSPSSSSTSSSSSSNESIQRRDIVLENNDIRTASQEYKQSLLSLVQNQS